MLKTLDHEFKTLEVQGYDVDHKGLSAGGFPLLFRSSLAEPDFSSPRAIPKPWSIKANKVTLQASVFNPLSWSVRHEGDARIDLCAPKGERWLFDVRPFSLDLQAKVRKDGTVKSLNAEINRPQIQAVIGTLPPLVGLDKARIIIQPLKEDMMYEVSSQNIFLEKDTLKYLQMAFGPKISMLDMIVFAKKMETLDIKSQENWTKSARLISPDWTIKWNDNVFTGDFDLTLTKLGLDGSIRAKVEDLPSLINQLTEAGMFTKQQATSLKMGAKLLPRNNEGRQEITFNLRQGYLLLFGQRLYKF